MFCTKCGQQIDDTAQFCVQCGNKVAGTQQPTQPEQVPPQQQYAQQQPQNVPLQQQYAQPQQPQYAQPQYAPYPQPKKSKTGLIVGLCVGGAVLIAAVILLVVFVFGGHADVAGKWYDVEGYQGTVEFSGSSVNFSAMGMNWRGSYSYDPQTKNGQIKISVLGMQNEMNMALEGDMLNIDGIRYTRTVVPQKSMDDIWGDLEDFSGDGYNLDDYNLDDFNFDDFNLNDFSDWAN